MGEELDMRQRLEIIEDLKCWPHLTLLMLVMNPTKPIPSRPLQDGETQQHDQLVAARIEALICLAGYLGVLVLAPG